MAGTRRGGQGRIIQEIRSRNSGVGLSGDKEFDCRWGHPPRGGSRSRSRSRSRGREREYHREYEGRGRGGYEGGSRGGRGGGDRPVWLDKYGPPTRTDYRYNSPPPLLPLPTLPPLLWKVKHDDVLAARFDKSRVALEISKLYHQR